MTLVINELNETNFKTESSNSFIARVVNIGDKKK
jgi:hypothetical protein